VGLVSNNGSASRPFFCCCGPEIAHVFIFHIASQHSSYHNIQFPMDNLIQLSLTPLEFIFIFNAHGFLCTSVSPKSRFKLHMTPFHLGTTNGICVLNKFVDIIRMQKLTSKNWCDNGTIYVIAIAYDGRHGQDEGESSGKEIIKVMRRPWKVK